MSMNQIKRILDAHSVPYKEQGGRVLADSMEAFTELFEHVEDVTDWTRGRLFGWLGY